MKYFIAGSTARIAAELADVHRNSAIRFFCRLRENIARRQQERSHQLYGKIVFDEKYFGEIKQKKKERVPVGKIAIFGIVRYNDKIYTQIVLDHEEDKELVEAPVKIRPDSIVYIDHWRGHSTLDAAEFKHYRINHEKFALNQHHHIDSVENFWNQSKRHMRKYNGIYKDHFNLFLKECEWRFNVGGPKEQLFDLKKILKRYS